MIKAIIFDLDGVLVDTKLIHFEALNIALKKNDINEISYEDHVKIFDGLPTLEKLKILKIKKNQQNKILKIKQKYTLEILSKNVSSDKKKTKLIRVLSKKYKIIIATNAVKSTLNICIKKLKIKEYINFAICNEDVKNPKPNPEIYLKIFIKFGLYPQEVMILEDSHYGRQAAMHSGGNLIPIQNLSEVNLKNINYYIKSIHKMKKINNNNIWEDKKLNILIPMAGAGKRFAEAGYIFPKPLIEINNKPMIQWVIESLNLQGNFIFIIQKEHQKKYNLKSVLNILQPNCKIIEIDGVTEGAACTTLLAKKFINNKNPLIIANSDQYIKWNSSKSMYEITSKKVDGAILVFESIHPKWSYVKSDKNGFIREVAEKKVISKEATVGVYYWKRGEDYVHSAEKMIKKNIRVNNEFYVCPVYNEAISDNKKIKSIPVNEMLGMGTPEDLQNFIKKIS
tara:strand:+ start:4690 stop:6048 length:1359 start_codon:yes stop_codon:yes gene_type:complete